jgi:hypothetical protein
MQYILVGKYRNSAVVEQYIANLIVGLKLHRLTSRVVTIEFMNTLDDECMGLCLGDSDESHVWIAKRSCGLKITFLEQMITLAHELVHVKQYIRKELTYNSRTEGFIWKGRNAAGYKYENQPWEKEAIGLSNILFVKHFPFHMEIN